MVSKLFCCLLHSFIIILFVINSTLCARILAVFPASSISHQVVFRSLTQELASRGHTLLIITPDPAFRNKKGPENIKEIDVRDVTYNLHKERFANDPDFLLKSAYKKIEIGMRFYTDSFELQLQSNDVQELIKSDDRFDLILVEACARSALVVSYIFKAPVIQISSFGAMPPNYQVFGAPSHPIFYPEFIRDKIYNLSVLEKIIGIYENYQLRYMQWSLESYENEMIRRNFGPEAPTVSELNSRVDMLFLNVHPIWDGSRPVPPGVIFMGGLHQKSPMELPEELTTYLDGSKNGVIFMSFGSNVIPSMLPLEKIRIFCHVFSKLPYDVLWKWDKDEIAGMPRNVRTFKWLPQSDLLRHPKIKMFITQGGLQSTDEAITAGVPLIAFPMFGDQWYNAEKYEYHGIGIKLDMKTLSEQKLQKSIELIAKDTTYRENMEKLRSLMQDEPQSPLERAVWWTEYVIRHGGAKHLRSAAANVSWTDYLMLDVVAVILSAVIILLVLIVMLGVAVGRLLGSREKLKAN